MAENEILAYFRETIFDPLRAVVGTKRLNEEAWTPFPSVWDSLRIPRARMPQIGGDDRIPLVDFLRDNSVRHVAQLVLPRELKPTQESYCPEKVAAARAHAGGDRPIFVSVDGRIVDGHHQWVRAMEDAPEKPILVWRFDVQIHPLLGLVRSFLSGVSRRNSEDGALRAALVAGTVWYVGGKFLGAFNSTISRELRALGASKVIGGFSLSTSGLPVSLQALIAEVKIRNFRLHSRITDTLGAIATNVLIAGTGISFANTVDRLWGDLQKQFVQSVSKVQGLAQTPPLSEEVEAEVRGRMTEETNQAIKNFSAEATADLRAKVQKNLAEGGRADQLARIIETEFGVAKRKARFIADNEISIATAQFRQARYESIGVTHYRWETMHDSKVRPTHGESNNHRDLEGRVFAWSSPPVVDYATGRRRHPGEDYNCRCHARPILDLR